MRFAGNCIDGPWRGRKVEKPGPEFCVSLAPRLHMLSPDPSYAYADPVAINHIRYRWSDSLGEWCMVY